ncbi:hypothetical protein C0992_001557 [Termitomyces sp. T32_za158]|nr:hypothetical protein C0992_001557 [Termitomyces sp. T32_za158]
MSAQEPEFIITRKRKRPVAIDPCLGFYCNISSLYKSQSPTAIATNVHDEDSDAADLPGWTTLPQDPSSPPSKPNLGHETNTSEPSDISSEPEPLTIETFLRRSALEQKRIHVRKYGRKRRNRRIIQSDDEDAEDDRPVEQQLDDRQEHLFIAFCTHSIV